MTTNLIKSVKQLPSWFKLENYKKSKNFNAGDWYDELMPRFYLQYCFKRNEKTPLDILQNWEGIKQHGLLLHLTKKEKLRFRMRSITPDLLHVKAFEETAEIKREFMSVNPLLNFNMYGGCYWYAEEEEQSEIVKKYNAILGDESEVATDDFQREVLTWFSEPFLDCPMEKSMGIKNKFAYAKIELEASDEQIKRDFATWLDYERKRRNCPAPKKNYSEADLDGWYESAVLPYLDLMFWSEIEKIKITQHVIAQAIFPDAYSLGSDIDPLGRLKTTKKKADYLMEIKTMKLLELQIED